MKKYLIFVLILALMSSLSLAASLESIQLTTGSNIDAQTELHSVYLNENGTVDQLALNNGAIVNIEDVNAVLLKNDNGKKVLLRSRELLRSKYTYMRNMGGDGSGGG